MAEECTDPSTKVPKAMSLCIPIGGTASLFFVLPICFTLPDLSDIVNNSPGGQVMPYIFQTVMGSPGGAVALCTMILILILFCRISMHMGICKRQSNSFVTGVVTS